VVPILLPGIAFRGIAARWHFFVMKRKGDQLTGKQEQQNGFD
jgi:hypothetical protein